MRWYAIQIYPQFRNLAEEHLKRQSYQYFFGDRISNNVTEPLFKGYGFVRFDIHNHRWTPINSTRGVVHLLPTKSPIPLPLPEGFVEDLIDNDPISDAALTQAIECYFPGQLVEITGGHLQGQRGEVSAVRNRHQLEILFLIGSSPKLWIMDTSNVRPGVSPDLG